MINTDRRALLATLIDRAAARFPGSVMGEVEAEPGDVAEFCRAELRALVERDLDTDDEDMVLEAVADLVGYGPIDALMRDERVTDVLINTHETVYVERGGRLEWVDVRFNDEEHLAAFVHRHVARAGRSVNRAHPWTDVELADGSRMHVVAAPVAARGHIVSIRRFRERPFTLDELCVLGAFSEAQGDWLRNAVAARLNIVLAGAPGAGKSTLLAALLEQVPDHERLIVIEDVSELKTDHPHCIKLQTRAVTHGGAETASIRSLVRETLRMRPDRLVIGEVRGPEAFDMITSLSTGMRGCLTTVHAGSTEEALARLTTLYADAGAGRPTAEARAAVESVIDAVIHLQKDTDGRRRVTEIRTLEGRRGSA